MAFRLMQASPKGDAIRNTRLAFVSARKSNVFARASRECVLRLSYQNVARETFWYDLGQKPYKT
jgi:hypothetical protein